MKWLELLCAGSRRNENTPRLEPSVEPLERRQLMSVATDAADVASGLTEQAVRPFKLNVKFQPPSTTTAPPRFRIDSGGLYGRHRNGLTYGWSQNAITAGVDRKSALSPDLRLDSYTKMNGGNTWSAAVPNGTYRVRALMGDPVDTANVDYRLRVEGEKLVNGIPEPGHQWVEGFRVVNVTDGKLTLSSDSRAVNNRLNFVEIVSVPPPAAPRQGANITWTRDRSFEAPIPRVESGGVQVGDNLYALGGYSGSYDTVSKRFDVLNVKTKQWRRLPDIPGPETHAGVASDGRYIYAVGGQFGPDKSTDLTAGAWKYDTIRNRWRRMPALPEVRSGGSLSYVNGVLYYAGGNDATRVRARAEQWVLDVTQPDMQWQVAPQMPLAVDHQGAAVVGGKIYVVGGDTDHGISYLTRQTLQQFDPVTNQWTLLAEIPGAASHNETSVLTDGKRLFVLGGQENQQQIIGSVRSYDIARNRWEVHPSMPAARKGGLSWMDRNRIYYFNGDELEAAMPTDLFSGVIG